MKKHRQYFYLYNPELDCLLGVANNGNSSYGPKGKGIYYFDRIFDGSGMFHAIVTVARRAPRAEDGWFYLTMKELKAVREVREL